MIETAGSLGSLGSLVGRRIGASSPQKTGRGDDERPLVLAIEDDPHMLRFFRAFLSASGYRLLECKTASEGMEQAALVDPALILLDLGLPDLDGIEVMVNLREWTRTPIIVLSARSEEGDKIGALDAGADDYLTKPFGLGELGARIRAALRRAQLAGQPFQTMLRVGQLRLDLVSREAFVGSTAVHLTSTEYKLLALLMRHAGKVMTHRQILTEIWGPSRADNTEYLRVYMLQLRQKLESDPARPHYLLNEPGIGYKILA